VRRMLMIRASRTFEYDMRNDFFRHVQQLGQRFFHRTQTGDLMARATNDLNYVRMVAGPAVMYSIDLIQVPFALAYMIYLSPKLTAMALLPIPILSGLVYFLVMYIHRQSRRVQEQFSEVSALAQENLAGARIVKAYGIEERQLSRFTKSSDEYMWRNMYLGIVTNLAWPFVDLCVKATVLIIVWMGGVLVIQGEMGLDDLTVFLFCLFLLAMPLVDFGWVMSIYQRGSAGMNRISQVFGEDPEIRDDAHTLADVVQVRGAIEFDNVSFAYLREPVLHDINLSVKPGETVAIVGPTGSGKSTLVSLLTREYDPTEGEIRIDGIDLRTLPLKTARGLFGYVPQDTFLFSDSVRENLTLGRFDAPEERMNWACEAAQFLETVENLPDGYETVLGERGINLSGGQKQRLAIARALIREPEILVLDDALSSVDTHTEEQILSHLKDVASDRTCVIISHRVSTVQHADQILVLDNGRIVERGTHKQLLVSGGAYATLYERQLLEDELEED
jgi:ATP-binding cassette, subfamily B, multidrug efflux pump